MDGFRADGCEGDCREGEGNGCSHWTIPSPSLEHSTEKPRLGSLKHQPLGTMLKVALDLDVQAG